ncbi:hypothetical protein POM88_025116 [Heracleum sosnowskyi]|uniref:Uncharacterized protein n=1 Tax=Heracleum sosnowskyi TaxID=360622 RepID=A0AAD8I5J9_9APIA|nr:hypothetical protein POM88_025116 [Heracleum sosnowskyi]
MGVDWPLVLVCLLVTKKERTEVGLRIGVLRATCLWHCVPCHLIPFWEKKNRGPRLFCFTLHIFFRIVTRGYELGGAVGGRLVEEGFVQAVACSFVYGDWKTKNSLDTEAKKDDKDFNVQPTEKSYTPGIAGPDIAPDSEMARLSPTCPGTRDPNTEFDAPNIGCDINMGVPSSVGMYFGDKDIKNRGRPRKIGSEANMSLALSYYATADLSKVQPTEKSSPPGSAGPAEDIAPGLGNGYEGSKH